MKPGQHLQHLLIPPPFYLFCATPANLVLGKRRERQRLKSAQESSSKTINAFLSEDKHVPIKIIVMTAHLFYLALFNFF